MTAVEPAAVHRPPNRTAGEDLLRAARRSLFEAAVCDQPGDRYVTAHLAALRAGAAVLAVRGRPTVRRSRIHSVWALLPRVAPELGEWAEFFEITARRRAAIENGVRSIGLRDADDLLRDARTFVGQVCDLLGVPHQLGVDSAVAPYPRAG